ncbi:MAG: hypothetical protein WBW08_03300 [Methyloceanibacter sp.]
MSAFGRSPVDIDELIRTTGLGARDVHIVLLELTSPAGCKAMGSSSSRLSTRRDFSSWASSTAIPIK